MSIMAFGTRFLNRLDQLRFFFGRPADSSSACFGRPAARGGQARLSPGPAINSREFLGKLRFPLKGSFKGDISYRYGMDIDIDTDVDV